MLNTVDCIWQVWRFTFNIS